MRVLALPQQPEFLLSLSRRLYRDPIS